jgi:polyketide synthase PksN
LDSALQASIKLSNYKREEVESIQPLLPFELDAMEFYSSTPVSGYAWARYSASSGAETTSQKFDIDICDEQGQICVRLEGLSLRMLTDDLVIAAGAQDSARDQLNRTTESTRYQYVQTASSHSLEERAVLQSSVFSLESTIPSATVLTDQVLEDHIRDVVRENIAAGLKIEQQAIQDDRPFTDYGVDSSISARLTKLISQYWNITIQATVLFDHSSIDQLVDYILLSYRDVLVEQMSNENIDESVPTGSHSLESIDSSPSAREANGSHRQRFRTPPHNRDWGSSGIANKARHDKINQGIAIVGMSGRFAQSDNLDQLWAHLANGKDLVTEASRWPLPATDKEGEALCRSGSFLNDIARFDPLFFNISGLEATYMDPQQRLFLEESWKALEDAGYVGLNDTGTTCGVYVGCGPSDYADLFSDEIPAQSFWGNSSSVLASRISYHLNLQGPAIAIDTACSSSLVAMHMASQALWDKEIDLAIAGGVFVQATSDFFQLTNNAGMLSATGHCHTFDARADGFVPGEGAGVVVLKRLGDALADGDHIYGVIRGSGINQDGATNGITAPSAKSQERLEREVYEKFAIGAEEIQYVEAHGTGTELGDPIEYQALTKAFRQDTTKKGYCAIGSIKTNLGHTVTAAGVAGVLKILLSLKHKQIPPSLHYQQGNPEIDFEDSPFYVNTELKEWEVEENRTRCAAVSSFGFSGTNAHMVIEEAPKIDRQAVKNPGHLIVLSARSEEQLRQQVEQLITHIEVTSELALGDISFTLLAGRKHFEHRLTIIVKELIELTTALSKWLETGSVSRIRVGHYQKGVQKEEASLKRYGNQCIDACKDGLNGNEYLENLSVVSDLYAQGYGLDYQQLFVNDSCSRISLPTYPFSKERYWVDDKKPIESSQLVTSQLHPLLHQNDSNAVEVSYSSHFSGEEFFFTDHLVKGNKVLPGVAHLEMARVAISRALRTDGAIELNDVVWLRPVVISDEGLCIHISVVPISDRKAEYDIYSIDEQGEETIYSQGEGCLIERADQQLVDLEALNSLCVENTWTSERLYSECAKIGLQYGCGFKGVIELGAGVDERGEFQVLSKFELPSFLDETVGVYGLHPSVLDSALQASIMLSLFEKEEVELIQPQLPFALDTIEFHRSTPDSGYAWVRYSASNGAEAVVRKFDIDICNEQSQVCVRLKGFSLRTLIGDIAISTVGMESSAEQLKKPIEPTLQWFLPDWEAVGGLSLLDDAPDAASTLVFDSAADALMKKTLKGYLPTVECVSATCPLSLEELIRIVKKRDKLKHVIWILPRDACCEAEAEALVSDQERGVLLGFRLVKALLSSGYDIQPLQLSVLTRQTQAIGAEEHYPAHASVHGFIGSVAKEQSHWSIRLLDLPLTIEEALLRESLCLPCDKAGNAWAYRQGQWYQQKLLPMNMPPLSDHSSALYRHGGVYVVIGGAGGLGEVWSEQLVQDYQAQLVWLGRRKLDATIQAKIDRLGSLGPEPVYLQVDAADREALEGARQQIRSQFENIHGLVHSAIVLNDKSVENMDEDHFMISLRAKVDTSVRLAQVFAKETLDFVVFFSSIQSFMKPAGQSNYVAGCTFQDAFVRSLEEQWDCFVKVMNWGYWGSVGIVTDEHYQNRMAAMGIGSIEPVEGMVALDQLLKSSISQLGFAKIAKLKAVLPQISSTGQVELVENEAAIETQMRQL